ncbi:type VI secretion system membrane subunit TssM [Zooshikella ganghwensis]|uniref:type VI secretion system membrane subunit TssM n=1 Tax=Zooshikella ganghwensis TaxID=202772 RepID=UPI00040E43E9|nr:type VI secretion system membrane subunit TssM [Zooshikella ganghwensis]
MKGFINVIKQKWFISLVGVIALSILIWFVGPLFAIADKKPLASEVVRLFSIMALMLLWGLNNLRMSMKAKKQNAQLIEGLQQDQLAQQSADAQESEEEIALLNDRFTEAMDLLRQSSMQGKSGKQFLYELPWYIIIGPPGCGKTTALVNSGLEFPLQEKFGREAIHGVGGTRHCDWWFTNESVLIDTAGRYTTQDSHASVDAAAWTGFLGLLKKNRPRRPINGVILAISLQDIALQTEAEMNAHVKAIRARLQELNERLGMRIPVYLMFTKCDLIEGFNEYFEDLGREERAQVWGNTFEDSDQLNVVELFDQGFDELLNRLNEQLLGKVHQERDVNRRGRILSFSQQLLLIKPQVHTFIEKVFAPSRFHHRPYLRGFYFTSGTQNITSIDRMVDSYANQMGVAPQPTHQTTGRSYFITRLLRGVIFAESGLVSNDRKYETGRLWVQRGSYAAALITAGLGAFAWSTSFTWNQLSIGSIEDYVKSFISGKEELRPGYREIDTIPVLDPLRDATQVYDQDKVPLTGGLGLYQGRKIQPKATRAYFDQVEEVFLPALKRRLEEQLKDNMSDVDFLHAALKAYIMLAVPKRLDEDYVRDWMQFDWENQLRGEAKLQSKLNTYLDDLLNSGFKPIKLDENLVKQARIVLRQVPLPQQAYARIKQEFIRPDTMRSFTSELGQEIGYVFLNADYKIPKLYTKNGFYTQFKPESYKYVAEIARDNWVLATASSDFSEADIKMFHDEVQDLYFQDYIKHWNTSLNELKVRPFSDIRQATDQLGKITAGFSPFREVLKDVEKNTMMSIITLENLEKANEVRKAAGVRSGQLGRLSRRAERLNRAADKAGLKDKAKPESLGPGANKVERQFRDVNQVILATGRGQSQMDQIIEALNGLRSYLSSIVNSGDPGESAYNAAKQKITGGRGDYFTTLKALSGTTPQPVRRWILDVTNGSWGLMMGQASDYLNQIYRANVFSFYKQALAGRYPIANARAEVKLRDFAEYFKPGGIEARFFDEYIKPFANTNRGSWRLRTVDGQSLGISSRALRMFETGAKIRRVFFQDGAATPQLNFSMKPVYLDANVARVEVDIDGQKLVYRHGPRVPQKVSWPQEAGESSILFEDLNGVRVAFREQGIWSFFRVMDNFRVVNSGRAERFRVEFKLDNRRADYELSANSVINPFNRSLLRGYNAVGRL